MPSDFPVLSLNLIGSQEQHKGKNEVHQTRQTRGSPPALVGGLPTSLSFLRACSLAQAGRGQHHPQKPAVGSKFLRDVAWVCSREVQQPTVGSA